MNDVIFGHNAVPEALGTGHPVNRTYFPASNTRPPIERPRLRLWCKTGEQVVVVRDLVGVVAKVKHQAATWRTMARTS